MNKLDKLTDRELFLLGLVSQGLTNKEISERAHIEYSTIRTHLYNIYLKLNLSKRQYTGERCSTNRLKAALIYLKGTGQLIRRTK